MFDVLWMARTTKEQAWKAKGKHTQIKESKVAQKPQKVIL